MKSPMESPRKTQEMPWYKLRRMLMHPQGQFQVIRSKPMTHPQVEKLLLLRVPKPTPQRRKVNCFQLIMSISWWLRSGQRSIKRSSKLCLITKQVRRPVSRVTRKTILRHRMPRKKTKTMVISHFRVAFLPPFKKRGLVQNVFI